MSNTVRVSVICNTCNRANHLRRLLVALSKQTYDEFEVIIVNGPSEDDTEEVLSEFNKAIRTVSCPVKKLGVSRNIGIMNAAGEICVFIDDDAVPGNKDWIKKLVEPYQDPKVGGVGGPVYDLQGGTQFDHGYVDVWGMPYAIKDNKDERFEDPLGDKFDCLMGCNCSFRTSVLQEVHGFDEFYDYFHDESDLSIRIIKAGYRIVQLSDAYVFHEKAVGHIRKDQYHLDWYTIMRSQSYFGIINSVDYIKDLGERERQVRKTAESRVEQFRISYERGSITEKEFEIFKGMWVKGLEDGLKAGKKGQRILLREYNSTNKFKRYRKDSFGKALIIVMLCENFDINDPRDGIASYTAQLSKDFASMGHCVHIVTVGSVSSFNLVENINIHTIRIDQKSLPLLHNRKTLNRVLTNSYEVMKKIIQLNAVFHIDIVESPLWNSMGLMVKYILPDIPLCVRLETPLRMVIKTQRIKNTTEIQLLEEMEKWLINRSDGILYISKSIKETIEDLYAVVFSEKAKINYLGIEPGYMMKNTLNTTLNILFVGRLERRKGIHNLLAIIPDIISRYPNVRFYLAGDDNIIDNSLGDTFKNWFLKQTDFKFNQNVKFLGKISNTEKEKLFQSCDIFVSPSLYESFGIVFLEAMRYGKPVIGCNIGGMREIIEHGVNGLLISPDNEDELKTALSKLITDDALRTKMGENAYSCVLNKFNHSIQAMEAIDIYKDIIAHKQEIDNDVLNSILQEIVLYREKYLDNIEQEDANDNNIISHLYVDANQGKSIMYEFPWKLVKAGENIIIYGGGRVGRDYIKHLKRIPYCNIVGVCDRNQEVLNKIEELGILCITIKELQKMNTESYDRILVAVYRRDVATSIIKTLEQEGIPKNKIIWKEIVE